MLNKLSILKYPHLDKIVFTLSALVCIFWYTGQHVNVYQVAVVGVLFEIAWLPMLALFIILPILSILLLIRKNISIKSLPLYSLLLLLTTFLILTFSK
jgi:hypothetical protein